MNLYVRIVMIALPKDKFIHGDAKKQAKLLTTIHKEARHQTEKANEAYKMQKNKVVKNVPNFETGKRKNKLMSHT